MARIYITIPDDLDRKLRTKVARDGGKKGDLSIAVTEAIQMWLDKKKEYKS
jgi:hypothetical protein